MPHDEAGQRPRDVALAATWTPTDRAARSFSRDARRRSPIRDCLKAKATTIEDQRPRSRERSVVVVGTPICVLVPRVIDGRLVDEDVDDDEDRERRDARGNAARRTIGGAEDQRERARPAPPASVPSSALSCAGKTRT